MTGSTPFPIASTITADDLHHDPYAVADRLRDTEPVAWADQLGMWLVVRRDDIEAILRDTATYSSVEAASPVMATFGEQMLNADPPQHKAHRTPCTWPFRPRSVEDHWQGLVVKHVDDLLDGLGSARQPGTAELRTALARPLVVRTIRDVIGLPASVEEIDRWYVAFADSLADFDGGGPARAQAHAAVDELRRRLEPTLDRAADSESGTLLATLVDDGVDADQAFRNVLIVLFGAVETTESLIANALWLMLGDRPASSWGTCDDKELAVAIEETTRFEPAVQTLTRFTTRPTRLNGVEIPAGQLVQCLVGGANRDPSCYSDPTRIDFARQQRRHLGYGYGIHYCLGADLARLEARVALRRLFERFPTLHLDRQRSTAPKGAEFRKPDALWVRW